MKHTLPGSPGSRGLGVTTIRAGRAWLIRVTALTLAVSAGCGDDATTVPDTVGPPADGSVAPVVDLSLPALLSSVTPSEVTLRAGHGDPNPIWAPGMVVTVITKGGVAVPNTGVTDETGTFVFDVTAAPATDDVVLLVTATDGEGYRAVRSAVVPVSRGGSLRLDSYVREYDAYLDNEGDYLEFNYYNDEIADGLDTQTISLDGAEDGMTGSLDATITTEFRATEQSIFLQIVYQAEIVTDVVPDDFLSAEIRIEAELDFDVLEAPAAYVLTVEGGSAHLIEFADHELCCDIDDECETLCGQTRVIQGVIPPRNLSGRGGSVDLDLEIWFDDGDYEDGQDINFSDRAVVTLEVIL